MRFASLAFTSRQAFGQAGWLADQIETAMFTRFPVIGFLFIVSIRQFIAPDYVRGIHEARYFTTSGRLAL